MLRFCEFIYLLFSVQNRKTWLDGFSPQTLTICYVRLVSTCSSQSVLFQTSHGRTILFMSSLIFFMFCFVRFIFSTILMDNNVLWMKPTWISALDFYWYWIDNEWMVEYGKKHVSLSCQPIYFIKFLTCWWLPTFKSLSLNWKSH